MSRGSVHLRSLTSLRFFAAAGVVWFHGAIWATVAGESQPLFWSSARLGSVGVTFFFMLSGFVLVWSSTEGDSIGSFYRRRFARVWPVHALMWLVALAVVPFGIGMVGVWSGLLNITLLQTWSTDPSIIYGFNRVSWSLSNEAFFYAMFPLLYRVARGLRPGVTISGAVVALLGVGLVANRLQADWVYRFPAYRVGEFIVGMALALIVQRGSAWRIPPAAAVVFTLGCYSVLAAFDMHTGVVTARGWMQGLGLMPALAVLIVAYAQHDVSGGGGWLARPLLVRLGQWSFALYMVHDLVLQAASPVMIAHAWSTPFFVAAAVALAGAVYEWFERPVERRLRGRARPAVQLEPAEGRADG